MRMAGPDVVLFVVGFLLFGGAAYAIYEEGGIGGTSALGAFDVAFSTTSTEAAREAVGSFASTQTFEIPVETRNVTRITLTVECTDPASGLPAAGYSLQLTLTPPEGLAAPDPVAGTCGQAISVDVPVATAPTATVAQGSTEAEAAANLPEFENAAAAVGTWTVQVSGARGGSQLPAQPPVGVPSGAIVLTAETWTPVFTPIQR